MDIKLTDLNYIILPGKFCDESQREVYESAYQFWQTNWSAIYKQLGTDKSAFPDDFFRQDFIPVITYQGQIVAIHLYTLYDLRSHCTKNHSYLSHNFDKKFFEVLEKQNLKSVMSMESLFVHSEFRKSKANIRLSDVIITLGQKLFLFMTYADAIIAPARTDNKVAQNGYTLGFEPVIQNFSLNNVFVDLVMCPRTKTLNAINRNSSLITEYLWEHRITANENLKRTA